MALKHALGIAMFSLVLFGAATGSVHAQAVVPVRPDQPARIGAFVFPVEFDGARRLSVREYETSNPGMGHSVGYQKGPITTTIYIYDMSRKTIPNDPDDEVLITELRSSLKEAVQFRKNAEVKKAFSLPDERQVARMNCAWLTYDGNVDGTICLGAANNKFIKFRTSAPETKTSLGYSIFFIRSWLPVFWPS